MTVTQFMTQVSGLSEAMLAVRVSDKIPIRPGLKALLIEKATLYANRLPLYLDGMEFQGKNELLWQFLTTNPEQLTPSQRTLADGFLSQYERAIDGLALIKHCIESHRERMDHIHLNAMFYQNRQGISLFSLLIANPLFGEWLFDYRIKITQNRAEEPSIDFSERESYMSPLKTVLLSSEKTAEAIESAITQAGTLFFWLYYFQQDAQRTALFEAILGFLLGSPKKLYTYDNLGAVLFDMLRSMKVSVEHKVLVQTFLESRFNEQVKLGNEHCWLTISLTVDPQETILATLRSHSWAVRSLNNPENMHTIRVLMRGKDDALQEIQTLLEQAQSAARRYSLFNGALDDTDAAAGDFQSSKRYRPESPHL
jgi:hypothetical protein